MSFTKTLHFRYNDVGQNSVFVFTFNDQPNPTAWKVAHIEPTGNRHFDVTYNQEFVFSRAAVDHGRVDLVSPAVDIEFHEEAKLYGLWWAAPQWVSSIGGNQFGAVNASDQLQHIATCLRDEGGVPEPVSYSDVSVGKTGVVSWTGRLRIYLVTGAQEGDLIKDVLPPTPLWDHKITETGLPDNWLITYRNGKFRITAD